MITGSTDEMVAGRKIDAEEVASFANGSALVIAHNAAFDRRFAERLSDVFITKPWACSMTQVDWANEGYDGLGALSARRSTVAPCGHALLTRIGRTQSLSNTALSENTYTPYTIGICHV